MGDSPDRTGRRTNITCGWSGWLKPLHLWQPSAHKETNEISQTVPQFPDSQPRVVPLETLIILQLG